MTSYDVLGRTYTVTRRADPRIGAAISTALGDATSVVNVGAGTGSYEPDTTRLAVEPSAVMIAQRDAHAAPAVQGVAEQLPMADDSVDAALAVLTVHHWSDVARGLAELVRVARRRVVLFTYNPDAVESFWLFREYAPAVSERDRDVAVPLSVLTGLLPTATIRPVPVPRDCVDGFGAAYWARPEAYLDARVRAGMSMFARHPGDPEIEAALARLERDVRSGRWHRQHADLLELDSLDVGYVLLTAEVPTGR